MVKALTRLACTLMVTSGLVLPLAASAQAPDAEAVKLQWKEYFTLSSKLARRDRKFLQRELKVTGKKKPKPPPAAKRFGFDPKQPMEFYRTEQGRRIADIVLSFQTPSGGWSKQVNMGKRLRKKGEGFAAKNSYVPTFDNYATTTQLNVLAKAYTATADERYKSGFLRGLNLLLQAQFPNGGWPQTFPLDGGYHDYITYNDKTMVSILEVLRRVADGKRGYAFVPKPMRRQSKQSFLKGINCILMTQVNSNGKFTVWAAQHDTFSLQPSAARAFEPVALASRESKDIVRLLMKLDNPPQVVIQAVEDAMAWFRYTQLAGRNWDKAQGVLVEDKNAKPLWARFYEIGSNRPVFGDRDGSVHYSIDAISQERRLGYGWFVTGPNSLFAIYEKWKARLPAMAKQ